MHIRTIKSPSNRAISKFDAQINKMCNEERIEKRRDGRDRGRRERENENE